jgi:hypothetical protein
MTTFSRPLVNAGAPEFPLPRGVIAILCLFFPIVGGAALYYAWRKSHPEAARYANRLSWLIMGPVLLVAVVAGAAAGARGKGRAGDAPARPTSAATR